ncbi:MAG: YaaL family protein [Clostridiaceae bacterium]|nr:YaaL family protein [Clostridiaceae bacterium]
MTNGAVEKQKPDVLNILRKIGTFKPAKTAEDVQKEENLKELRESINDAYREWQNALSNFESAEGKEMVDYYIYRIKASQIRYDYLLKKAKEAMNQ